MKLSFDPDKNDWTLPEEQLQQAISKAIVRFEESKLAANQSKKFLITTLFVISSVVGGTICLVMGQFLPVLIGAAMYWYAYDLARTYIEGKPQ